MKNIPLNRVRADGPHRGSEKIIQHPWKDVQLSQFDEVCWFWRLSCFSLTWTPRGKRTSKTSPQRAKDQRRVVRDEGTIHLPRRVQCEALEERQHGIAETLKVLSPQRRSRWKKQKTWGSLRLKTNPQVSPNVFCWDRDYHTYILSKYPTLWAHVMTWKPFVYPEASRCPPRELRRILALDKKQQGVLAQGHLGTLTEWLLLHRRPRHTATL